MGTRKDRGKYEDECFICGKMGYVADDDPEKRIVSNVTSFNGVSRIITTHVTCLNNALLEATRRTNAQRYNEMTESLEQDKERLKNSGFNSEGKWY